MKNKTDKNIIYEKDDYIVFKDSPQTICNGDCWNGLTVKQIEEMEHKEVLEIERQNITYKKIYVSVEEK